MTERPASLTAIQRAAYCNSNKPVLTNTFLLNHLYSFKFIEFDMVSQLELFIPLPIFTFVTNSSSTDLVTGQTTPWMES